MKRYSELLYPLDQQPEILQGIGSSIKFIGDGGEFEGLIVGKKESASKVQSDYISSFEAFSMRKNPIMFSLKPMRELLNMYRNNKKKTTSLLSNVTLYIYGSFNFRCIIDKEYGSIDLENLLMSFKRVNLYETYFAEAGNGNANRTTMPGLYSHIDARCEINDLFWSTLVRLIHLWNDHIKIQMASNHDATSKNILERIACDDQQMVLADFGLAAMYWTVDPPGIVVEKISFHPDTKYTVPIMASRTINLTSDQSIKTQRSNIFLYKNISIKEIETTLLEIIQSKNL